MYVGKTLFAQLTWRESLRDIEVTLGANTNKLYAMGLRNMMHRSTLGAAQRALCHSTLPRESAPYSLQRPETEKTLIFLTNNFVLPPLTIAALYKNRWQVELFFKWIKQHLRIKSF